MISSYSLSCAEKNDMRHSILHIYKLFIQELKPSNAELT